MSLGGGTISGGNIEIKVSAKYDDKGLGKLEADLKKSERAAKGLDGEMKDVDDSMDKATRSSDKLGKSSTKTGSKMKSGLKAGAAAGAAAIGVGLVMAFKKSYTEAREAQKVTAQTEAVLKSTGKSANVTANQLGRLSESISNKTAIDDEQIQSGANLLLTFKDIKNEAGAGNDIFNQTTKAMIDMSVAMKQDTKASAIQLGKALNDPIKGIGALSRVGVQFTDDQKAMIEGLVESGDKMKAQKIILKELNSQFGGSAAAAANPMERLQVVLNNVAEDIGKELLPYIDKAADALIKFVMEFKKGEGAGGDFKDLLKDLAETAKNLWPILKTVGGAVYAVVKGFASLPKEAQIAIVSLVALSVAALKVYQLVKVIQASTMAMKIFGGVARMLPLMMGPMGIALMGIVAIGILCVTNWDMVKENLLISFNWIKDGAVKMANLFVKAAKMGFLGPVPFIIANWKKVKDVLGSIWNWVKTAVSNTGKAITWAAQHGFAGPVPMIIANWKKVLNFFKELPGNIWGALSGIGSTIARPFIWAYKTISRFLQKTVDAVQTAVDKINSIGSGIGGGIRGGIGWVGDQVGFADGGKVGPGAGGAKMFVAGEGGKPEWVISQEGPRNKNIGYLADAANALGVGKFAKGGKVQGAETRAARAELTPGLGDDIRAAKELRGIYASSVKSLDRKLHKDGNGLDWFDKKYNKKKAKKKRATALSDRLSDLGSLKQYRDQVKELTGATTGDSASMSEQLATFNAERFSLLSSFAGNIRGAAGAVMSNSPRAGATVAPAAVQGSTGTEVKIVQNYTEPPKDPHAWTRNIQNEIAAVI